jgi:hypothetical protein
MFTQGAKAPPPLAIAVADMYATSRRWGGGGGHEHWPPAEILTQAYVVDVVVMVNIAASKDASEGVR